MHALDGNGIAEFDAGGGLVTEYVWLEERPVAVIDHSGVSPETSFVHTDHLERPVMMTDAGATVVWRAAYLPFGEVASLSGPATLNDRFPGQWFQLESGLHYNWHRHDDPSTGRYLQPDPLGMPDGPSRWAYVRNSPLMEVDPEGLQSLEDRREFTPIPNPFDYDPKVFYKTDPAHAFPTMFDPHIWYFGWFCGCGVSSEGLYYQRCLDGAFGGKRGRYELGMDIKLFGGGSLVSHRVFIPEGRAKREPGNEPRWGWPID